MRSASMSRSWRDNDEAEQCAHTVSPENVKPVRRFFDVLLCTFYIAFYETLIGNIVSEEKAYGIDELMLREYAQLFHITCFINRYWIHNKVIGCDCSERRMVSG